MDKKRIKKILPVCLIVFGAIGAKAETLTVSFISEGPREGSIAILLFENSDGFPNKHEKAKLKARFPVPAEGPIQYKFEDLPYGRYALVVYHDVNDNHSPDKRFKIGPPKEPVGFSGIDKKVMKNPKFRETDFIFSPSTRKVTVKLFYVP